MNRLTRVANPIVVTVLICAFLYVYFFYLRGYVPPSQSRPREEREVERNWENVPQKAPVIVGVAGTVTQQAESPITLLSPQNVVQSPNLLDAPLATPAVGLAAPPTQDINPPVKPNPDANLPAQPNQGANVPGQPVGVLDVPFIEGHWIGLEVIPLTAAIAVANSVPPEVTGVLIDEVTLLSAAAGLFAGDVITAVNGKRVGDLKSFEVATKDLAQPNRATVSIVRGGKPQDIMVISTAALGVAQMEGAPMIVATARSPHPYYGPCDRCHIIAKNGLNPNELLKDQGDSLTKVAPNIRAGTPPPHRNRGTCTSCHVVLR